MNVAHQLDGENTICGRWWVTERTSLQRKPLSDQLTNAKVGSTVNQTLPQATWLRRNFITRAGMGLCLRPNRYALASATGSALGSDVFALHECDDPVCFKVSGPGAPGEHVVAGTQFDNMRRMARARRGGGRPTIRGLGREARRARSVALREAVQGGVWDADAVANALLGAEPRLF